MCLETPRNLFETHKPEIVDVLRLQQFAGMGLFWFCFSLSRLGKTF